MSRLSKFVPSRRWLFLPPILIGVGIVAVLAMSKKELPRSELSETATPLRVVKMRLQPLQPAVTGFGTARPGRRWSAVAEVGGRITETHSNLRSGIEVDQDEMLLTIDREDYELQLRQRRADLSQAESQLEQLRLNRDADEKSFNIQKELLQVRIADLDRLEKLGESSAASQTERDASRAVSLQQMQTVQTLAGTLSTYPAKIDAAEATIETAKARVDEAQRNLDRTVITAPFDGLLKDVNLEPGQYVAPGQSLFEVVDTSWIEVEAQFSMAQLDEVFSNEIQLRPSVDRGDRFDDSSMADQYREPVAEMASLLDLQANVIARSGDVTRSFPGRPIRLMSTLNEQTRTLGIVIRVDNPTGPRQLRAGAYCEVSLIAKEPARAFAVPRTGLNDGSVFVVDGSNRLARRQVSVAFMMQDSAAVDGGLSEGDLVVIHPPAVAMDGELVEPIETGVTPVVYTAVEAEP